MAIGSAGWAMINVAMAKASPKLLAKTGPAVSKLVGKPVAATSASIMGALRSWAANNPKKFLIASNLLAAIGIDIAADSVVDAVSDFADNPEISALLSEVQATIVTERAEFTGDGKIDTVHGVVKDDYQSAIDRLVYINDTIKQAIQSVGSLRALEAIRAAIFLEDADFESYRMTRF